MPEPGSTMKFKACWKTQMHPIGHNRSHSMVILEKTDEKWGSNAVIIHEHKPMYYGILVKTADNVPAELEEFDIRYPTYTADQT